MGRTVKAPEYDVSLIKERRATLLLFFHSPITPITMRLLKSSLIFVALLFLVQLSHLAAAAGSQGEGCRTSKTPKRDCDEARASANAENEGDKIDYARMPKDFWIKLRRAYNDQLFHMSKKEVKFLRRLKDEEVAEIYKDLHEAATAYRNALKCRSKAMEHAPVPNPGALSKDNPKHGVPLQCAIEKEAIPLIVKRIKRYEFIISELDPWEYQQADMATRRNSTIVW